MGVDDKKKPEHGASCRVHSDGRKMCWRCEELADDRRIAGGTFVGEGICIGGKKKRIGGGVGSAGIDGET
eukprot:jgi/Psemu1/316470/fgenesh1_kg.3418_\